MKNKKENKMKIKFNLRKPELLTAKMALYRLFKKKRYYLLLNLLLPVLIGDKFTMENKKNKTELDRQRHRKANYREQDKYGRSILRCTCDPNTFARKRTYVSNFFD